MAGRKLQFPTPQELSDAIPVAWRSREVLVKLYNAGATPNTPAKAFSAKVKSWIETEAKKHGWGKVHFPLDYPNKSKFAGAVFVKAGNR